jgi:hypothetical protein
MSNKLLQDLEDTKNRKFPIVYKHIVETIREKQNVDSGFVNLSPEKKSKSSCFNFHKPISKLL